LEILTRPIRLADAASRGFALSTTGIAFGCADAAASVAGGAGAFVASGTVGGGGATGGAVVSGGAAGAVGIEEHCGAALQFGAGTEHALGAQPGAAAHCRLPHEQLFECGWQCAQPVIAIAEKRQSTAASGRVAVIVFIPPESAHACRRASWVGIPETSPSRVGRDRLGN
jgi:hypothetical protein